MIREDIKEILRNMKVADAELFTCACDIEDYIDNLLEMVKLGEHYKHLYSEVKKQKDDGIKYIKEHLTDNGRFLMLNEWQVPDLLRMLGEIDE